MPRNIQTDPKELRRIRLGALLKELETLAREENQVVAILLADALPEAFSKSEVPFVLHTNLEDVPQLRHLLMSANHAYTAKEHPEVTAAEGLHAFAMIRPIYAANLCPFAVIFNAETGASSVATPLTHEAQLELLGALADKIRRRIADDCAPLPRLGVIRNASS